MIRTKQYALCIISLLPTILFAQLPVVTPYYPIRSQGTNTARHLSGWAWHINKPDRKKINGIFSVTPGYTRSFDSNEIVRCLFGSKQKCNALTISGSRVTNRGANDLLADYFYLPTDYKSIISFDPVIESSMVDFSFYLSFDGWHPGLYVSLHAPIVHSHWDLNMCEKIVEKGINPHPAGYFTPNQLDRKFLLNTFTEYANGLAPGAVAQNVIGAVEPGTPINNTTAFLPLRAGKMSCQRIARTRVPDIRGDFGWNFVLNDESHAGISLSFSAPVGNRPDGIFLFEPMVGNGHHWELGGAFNAHYSWFCGEDEQTVVTIYGDAHITSLLETKQKRTLDLYNGSLSRYMLAQQLSTPVQNNLQGNGTAPTAVFKRQFTPVANLTRMTVDVHATLQAELTAFLNVHSGHFNFDVGYSFWARTCERMRIRGFNLIENNTKWAWGMRDYYEY